MLKDKVKIVDGCWIWQGYKIKNGYGRTTRNYKQILAHRLSYQLNIGDIPEGLCVCHTCDVRACINPDHLFLGTIKDNNQDKINKGRAKNPTAEQNAAKTHCPQGHEYNEINTRIDYKGHRKCKTCTKERHAGYQRAYRARKRKGEAPRGQSGQCGGE